MYWVDCHVHLSSFDQNQLGTIFIKSSQLNIQQWYLAGYDKSDWLKQFNFTKKSIFKAFGLHPWQVLAMSEEQRAGELQFLESILVDADFCGETGIDGFRSRGPEDLEIQQQVFKHHLELNRKFQKPMVLHVVKSHELALNLLKKYDYSGLVHGYSGSWELAQEYIKMGYKISIGRGIYQKGYKHLKEVALKINVSDFVLESDASDDGSKEAEDPAEILMKVGQAMSEIKSVSLDKIQEWNFINSQSVRGGILGDH